MPKSIESRVAAVEKVLGECVCSGRYAIQLSSQRPPNSPAVCERCGRELCVIRVQDPYEEPTEGAAHE